MLVHKTQNFLSTLVFIGWRSEVSRDFVILIKIHQGYFVIEAANTVLCYHSMFVPKTNMDIA